MLRTVDKIGADRINKALGEGLTWLFADAPETLTPALSLKGEGAFGYKPVT